MSVTAGLVRGASIGTTIGMIKVFSNKKPPCSECKRFRKYTDNWHCTAYFCDTGKPHAISGNNIEHSCWWYRYSPFCKFEKDDATLNDTNTIIQEDGYKLIATKGAMGQSLLIIETPSGFRVPFRKEDFINRVIDMSNKATL